jgi:hypothetical protein
MMKFKVGGKEYKVPEYITIENYTKIYKVKDMLTENYFAAKLVHLITDAPMEELLECDYQELNYVAAYIMSIIPTERPQFSDRFELNGVHYGFFPKWNDLTYAEFVDMDTISTKKEDELLNMLHILAAIMYRPITTQKSEHDFEIEKYDVKTMIARSELFKKELDCRFILGAQFFFIKYAKTYLLYTQTSSIPKLSTWMKVKLIWKMRSWIWRAISKGPSGGLSSQTELLEMILQNTTTYTKKV